MNKFIWVVLFFIWAFVLEEFIRTRSVANIKKLFWILMALSGVFFIVEFIRPRPLPETPHIITVSEATFAEKVEQSDQWVLADFWAPWCGPCLAMLPDLDALSQEFSGRVRFVKINVDENRALAERFRVSGLPQLYLFRDGQAVSGLTGRASRDDLRAWIEGRLALLEVPSG